MPVAWGLSYFWPSPLSTMFLLGSGALSIASVVRTGREKKRAQAALVDKIGLSSSQMDQVVRAWQHKVAARRRALPAVPSARRQGDSFAEAVAPHAAGLDLLAVQVWRELHGESLQGASTTSTLPARDASREE